MIATRFLIALLALAAAIPAQAAEAPFPSRGDIWRYGVQAPGDRGVTRYATVEATPAGASWTVTVTCGTHDARTGRILTRHVGQGTSERGRGPASAALTSSTAAGRTSSSPCGAPSSTFRRSSPTAAARAGSASFRRATEPPFHGDPVVIATLFDHVAIRTVVIPTLTAGYAATIPPKEQPFPANGDRFLMAVRGQAVNGRAGFARVYASPAGKNRWTTTVTCGSVDVRTGRERIELQAPGKAWHDRDGLGGTWSPLGGGQMRVWSVTRQDGLDVEVAMAGPCPPTGAGDVSSGD